MESVTPPPPRRHRDPAPPSPAGRSGVGTGAGAGCRRSATGRRLPGPTLALATALLALLAGSCRDGSRPPPVILVVIDTLRADHLGFDGYPLDTSPVLDDLAARSHVFTANTTQCNATFASLTSILTGLYPKTHLNYLPVPVEGTSAANRGAASLPERLDALGYHSIAVVSHPAWTERPEDMALGRGWDAFSVIPEEHEGPERRGDAGRADATNARALAALEGWTTDHSDQPLLLWVHYFDPHTPYDPPPPDRDRFLDAHLAAAGLEAFKSPLRATPPGPARTRLVDGAPPEVRDELRLADGRALYDGEIRFTDRHLGLLFERLRELDAFDEALVIVMADHGENLDEAAWGHGRINFSHQGLYEGVSRTPLLVKLPHQSEGRRVDGLTQNIDVLPTVLEVLGLPPDPTVQGRSLVPLLEDPGARIHERVFVESSDRIEKAVREDALKYIDDGSGAPRLFQWRDDPHETDDLASSAPPAAVQRLRAALDDFRPVNRLEVMLVPDARPYTVELEVELLNARLARTPAWCRAEGDRRISATLAVDRDPVQHTLFLDRPDTSARWSVAMQGGAPVVERVVLGGTPLDHSPATPVYTPEGPPPGSPLLVITHDEGALDLALPQLLGTTEVELRPLGDVPPRSLQDVAVTASSGFSDLQVDVPLRRALLVADAPASARLSLPAGPFAPVARVDGRWIAPSRIALDGQGVDPHRIELWLLPESRVAGLLFGDAPPRAAPGSLVVWATTTGALGDGTLGDLEGADLDSATVEQLRALGYMR